MVKAAWAGAADADSLLVVVDAPAASTAMPGAVIEQLASRPRPALLVDQQARHRPAGGGAAADRRRQRRPSRSPRRSSSRPRPATAATISWRRWRPGCPRARGCSPRISSPTSPIGRSRPRSRASRCFSSCTTSCPTASRSRPRAGRSAADGAEVRIDQTIYVLRASQKAIVLGKGGRQIKAIGEAARRELERSSWTSACIFSCSSRCARAGPRIRSATARWVSTSSAEPCWPAGIRLCEAD